MGNSGSRIQNPESGTGNQHDGEAMPRERNVSSSFQLRASMTPPADVFIEASALLLNHDYREVTD